MLLLIEGKGKDKRWGKITSIYNAICSFSVMELIGSKIS